MGYTVFIQRDSNPLSPKIHKVETFAPGDLRGMCGPRNPCVGENTICDSGQCVCKVGFIEKRHKCVPSLCSKPDLQFQCDDGTACIALYNVCNGITECRDGSDEIFCDKSAFPPPLISVKPSFTKSPKVGSRSNAALHNIVSSPSRNHFPGASRLLYHSGIDGDSPEADFDSSLKGVPSRTFQIIRNLPSRRSYDNRREYPSPDYYSTIGTDEPTLIASEPRRKSFLSDEALDSFIDRPSSHLRTRVSYAHPNFLEEPQYPVEGLDFELSQRKNSRLPGRSYFGAFQELSPEEEEVEIPHLRKTGFVTHRGFLRRKPIRHQKHSSDSRTKGKHLIDEDHTNIRSALDKTEAPISSFVRSGYQWHTAAILLAVGLGLISCLFGILVGRCRQRGRFDKEGPRSKAVAQSHLRRRILRTRGLSNSGIEKSGLLSKLQL
nr:Low density lipoprotein receptor class A cysteine rich [Hymenolepis microstoma]